MNIKQIAGYILTAVVSVVLTLHIRAELYPAPSATPVPSAAVQADLIRTGVTLLGDSVLAQYGTIHGYIAVPGVTRAQTIAALGADAQPLNQVATQIRVLLNSIDPSLAAKYDQIGPP